MSIYIYMLTDSDIDEAEYSHARNIWTSYHVQTLGEYSDLYMKTDVLLLADVFENFRSTCLEAYGLDPAHYYTTPGLTWDAMLKHTQVELELLTDIDMLLFVEKGIRGGVSQCCNRYAKANNQYMSEGFESEQEKKFLMYYDVNNLYGWAMTQALPYGGFKWVKHPENLDVTVVGDDDHFGYIVEVDLEYPESLHDSHKDLPLCPQHLAAPGSKQEKLMTTLYNKERYVIHYRALKQALSQGLVIRKIHRALCFEQKPWLKSYVDLNTEKRKQAKNEFEKLFFKLLVNAVYGKTMENERKRVNVKLVNKWHGRYGAEALIAKPNFHSRAIFDENLVAVQLSRTEIEVRKPVYVGLSVLDLSKINVYDFHYSYMLQRLGVEKCKLLYTDTDSLIYEIKGVDMYEEMKRDLHRFDTSDYAQDNPFAMPRANKKVLGIMKDECCGHVVTEFIGLRSKMYSVLIEGQQPIKKAKGVKSTVVKICIDFEDYRRCLFEQDSVTRQQCNIRSRLHVVTTDRENKLALSPHDDKRCLLEGSTDTLPWGHYSLRVREEAMRRRQRPAQEEAHSSPPSKRARHCNDPE